MLQILGDSMLIATRMDSRLHRHADHPARPLQDEASHVKAARRGWLHLAGILL